MNPRPSTTSRSGSPTATGSRSSYRRRSGCTSSSGPTVHPGRLGRAPREADPLRRGGAARARASSTSPCASRTSRQRWPNCRRTLDVERPRTARPLRRRGRGLGSAWSRRTRRSSTTSTMSPCSADPAERPTSTSRSGFNAAEPGPSGADRVEVGGAYVEFHPGDATEPERPLLNHLAMRVESAAEHIDEAKEQESRSTRSSTPRTRTRSSSGAPSE